MSTLELKARVFEKLAAINEEARLKKILSFLENLDLIKNELDVDSFFIEASRKYDDVLQKLSK